MGVEVIGALRVYGGILSHGADAGTGERSLPAHHPTPRFAVVILNGAFGQYGRLVSGSPRARAVTLRTDYDTAVSRLPNDRCSDALPCAPRLTSPCLFMQSPAAGGD